METAKISSHFHCIKVIRKHNWCFFYDRIRDVYTHDDSSYVLAANKVYIHTSDH